MDLILEPSAKNNFLKAWLVLGFILLLVFFDVIFLGKTLGSMQIPGVMGDGPYQYPSEFKHRALIDPGGSTWSPRPQTDFVSQTYHKGKLPLWIDTMGLGQPLAANMDSIAFNPMRFFLYLNPSPFTWDLFLIFRLFLAGIFTYLFMQSLRMPHLTSLFSAILFMLSGYLIFCIDMHHLDIEVLIPLVLLCFEKLLRSRRQTFWRLATLFTVFLTNVGGHPESTFLILCFGYIYYLFRLFSVEDSRKKFLAHLGVMIYVNIIGFALSAFLLLPFYEYMHLAASNHDVSRGHAPGTSYNPFTSDFIAFLVPYFFGPIHGSWLEGYSWHTLTRGYVGVGSMLFALTAMMGCLCSKTIKAPGVFFTIILTLMLCKFYGFGFINWIGLLPLANMIIFGKYMGPLIGFSFAILAGLGLEAMSKEKSALLWIQRSKKILFVLGGLSFMYFLKYISDHNDHYAAQAFKLFKIIDINTTSLVSLQLFAALAFLACFMWMVKLYVSGSISENRFKTFAIVLVTVELFIYIPNPGIKKSRNKRYDIFSKAPYIEFLQKNIGHQRVIGIDRHLYPDFASVYGISDLRVLDGMLPKDYMNFIQAFFTSPHDRFTGDEGIDFQDPHIKKVLNLLGVKYFLRSSASNNFIEDIVKKGHVVSRPDGGTDAQWINRSSVAIAGINKEVMFEHAPARINYPMDVVKGSKISFHFGFVPGAAAPDKGDGAAFEVLVQSQKGEQLVFSKTIDPKANDSARQWHSGEVDLSDYAGQKIQLCFITRELQSNEFDWCVWGDIQLTTPDENTLALRYNHELKIYENREALSRCFVVHDYEVEAAPEKVYARIKNPDFDIQRKIILEMDLPADAKALLKLDQGTAISASKIISYQSDEVLIEADMAKPGLLVLSDLHYPGWSVYVDGMKQEVLRANSMLRSVYLNKGRHEVRFAYEPFSFRLGAGISLAALVLILVQVALATLVAQKKTNPRLAGDFKASS